MKTERKKKLENLKKKHKKFIKSLGVDIDKKSQFKGYPLPDYSCKPSIPTSDRIAGPTTKKYYTNTIPAGKTISVAYNKGPYMVIDAKDFKTMGK